jgi:hypothetical protein
MKLPSAHQVGEKVELHLDESQPPIDAFVRAVIFTSSKVRYSLWLRSQATTLHNIDSTFVNKAAVPETMEFGEDNYS